MRGIFLGLLLLPLTQSGRGYTLTFSGQVVGYRLAGVEPDGDPLYQVVLRTRLSASAGAPAANLIVSSYLENFQPDTTPVLPDLLHPGQNAQNLGGFLQGKALLTDDAGNVVAIGSFLAEAFLDNSNHAVMTLFGSNQQAGSIGKLKGRFVLLHSGALTGSWTGRLDLPPAARRQILAHRGARLKPIKQIISVVTVRPHAMMGRATTTSGTPTPLHTGYGTTIPRAVPTRSGLRKVSPWTIASGIGAVVSLLLAGFLFWWQRRTASREAV